MRLLDLCGQLRPIFISGGDQLDRARCTTIYQHISDVRAIPKLYPKPGYIPRVQQCISSVLEELHMEG